MNKKSPLFIVFFTVFLDLLGFGILIPLQPFVALKFNATGFEIGLLMASYSFMQFLFAPFWGRLSDRYGRRPVVLLSLVGSSAGYLLFAYATSLQWLFVSRILSGMAAANISTAQAIVADCLPPSERTKGMGMVGAAIGLGFILGPAMGGFLVGESNYHVPFLAAAGLSGLDLILALFLLPETVALRNHSQLESRRFSVSMLRKALQVDYIPRLLSISLLYFIAFAAMEGTLGLYVEKMFSLTARQNSYLFLLVGVVMVIIQGGVVGRVAKRLGDHPTLNLGICGVFLGLFSIGISPSLPSLIASMFILAVFSGLANPAMSSLISQLSAQEVQGGMLGLNQSMSSLGRIIGPLMGGECFDAFGPRSPYFIGMLLVMLAFILSLSFRLNPSKSLNLEGETAEPPQETAA